jgi:hypothetical protein
MTWLTTMAYLCHNDKLYARLIISTSRSYTQILTGATRSRISYHLRDIYSMCMCCWNGATHKLKVHNGKIVIISFVSYGHHHDLVDLYGISVSQWQTICSTYHKHFTVLYSFTTYYRVCNYINTTGVTNGASISFRSTWVQPRFLVGFVFQID